MWWVWTAANGWCADDIRVGPTRVLQSLADALAVAQAGDRIVVDAGVYLEDTDFTNVVDLEIDGAGSDPITGTIFAGGGGTSLWHTDGSSLVLRDLVLDGGGNVRGLTIERSRIEATNLRIRNGFELAGGGIHVSGSTLSLVDSTVESNTSTSAGGGMYVEAGSNVVLDGVVFTANHANTDGGGAWVGPTSDVTVRGTSFVTNEAQYGGGLVCSDTTRCLLEDTAFEDNEALLGGGGFYAFEVGDLTVVRGWFCENRVTAGSGGGATLFGTVGTMRNVAFLGDEASANGGSLQVHNTELVLENNTFAGARAGARGGAIFQDGASSTRSANNVYHSSIAALLPNAAVDMVGGTRNGGWDMYFGNTDDAFPDRLPNDWTLDPLLVLSGCALPEPQPASPTLDAGDPTVQDPDGTRSDIGVTGGPNALRDRDADGIFDGEDCDDADAGTSPDATEVCDLHDNDCDAVIDEGCPAVDPDPAEERASDGEDASGDGCGCNGSSSASFHGARGWVALLVVLRGVRRRAKLRR